MRPPLIEICAVYRILYKNLYIPNHPQVLFQRCLCISAVSDMHRVALLACEPGMLKVFCV